MTLQSKFGSKTTNQIMSCGVFWLHGGQTPRDVQEIVSSQFIKKGINISKMNCYADIPKFKVAEREELLNFGFILMDSPQKSYMERAALLDISNFVNDTTETTVVLITEDVTFPVFLNRLKSAKKFKLIVVSSSPFAETPSYFIDKVIPLHNDTDLKLNFESMEHEFKGLFFNNPDVGEMPIAQTIHLGECDEVYIDGNMLEMANPVLRNICKYNGKLGDQIIHSLFSSFQKTFEKNKKFVIVFDKSEIDNKLNGVNDIELWNAKTKNSSVNEILVGPAHTMKDVVKLTTVFITSDFELTARLLFYGVCVYKASDFLNLVIERVNGSLPDDLDTFFRSFINKTMTPITSSQEKYDFEKATLESIISLCRDDWNNIGYVNENLSINTQKVLKNSYGRMSQFLRNYPELFSLKGDYVHYTPAEVKTEEKKEERLEFKEYVKREPKDTHSASLREIFEMIYKIAGQEWTNRGFVFENLPLDMQKQIKKEYVTMTGFFKHFGNYFQLDYDYVKMLKQYDGK
jgi:hypothetical protein